jgi:hypothetical protein
MIKVSGFISILKYCPSPLATWLPSSSAREQVAGLDKRILKMCINRTHHPIDFITQFIVTSLLSLLNPETLVKIFVLMSPRSALCFFVKPGRARIQRARCPCFAFKHRSNFSNQRLPLRADFVILNAFYRPSMEINSMNKSFVLSALIIALPLAGCDQAAEQASDLAKKTAQETIDNAKKATEEALGLRSSSSEEEAENEEAEHEGAGKEQEGAKEKD